MEPGEGTRGEEQEEEEEKYHQPMEVARSSSPSLCCLGDPLLVEFEDQVGDAGPSSVEVEADANELREQEEALAGDVADLADLEEFGVPGQTQDSDGGGGGGCGCGEGGDSAAASAADLFSGVISEPATPSTTATATAAANMTTLTPMGLGTDEKEQEEDGNVRMDSGVPGICGLRNIGNTCYMNAGLQCVLSTPPVVDFFLRYFQSQQKQAAKKQHQEEAEDELEVATSSADMLSHLPAMTSMSTATSSSSSSKADCKDVEDGKGPPPLLTSAFAPLASLVWAGEFSVIRPTSFKEALGKRHSQFQGSLQHDCQEFLAILLDAMHDELHVGGGGGFSTDATGGMGKATNKSDCNTSMELHSSMSLDREAACAASAAGFSSTGRMSCWVPEQEAKVGGMAEQQAQLGKLEEQSCKPGQHELQHNQHNEADGNESTGSPRSFDSQSSLDDKISSSIRNRPIPKELRSFDASSSAAMDEDTMDSTSSSVGAASGSNGNNTQQQQPTSNLVAPDSLMKKGPQQQQQKSEVPESQQQQSVSNNSSSSVPHSLEDLISKDNKTLNVNVLADGGEDGQVRNNELSFDSEKFCRRRCAEKNARMRPREAIDNDLGEAASSTADEEQHQLVLQQQAHQQQGISQPKKSRNVRNSNHQYKRFKMNNVDGEGSHHGAVENEDACVAGVGEEEEDEDGFEFSAIKRMRLDSADREKNVRMALSMQQQEMHGKERENQIDEDDEPMVGVGGGDGSGASPAEPAAVAAAAASSAADDGGASVGACAGFPVGRSLVDTRDLKEAIEAERYWEKYLASNDTVVARTFQGLFKNTVVCSECQYPSVTFEPFMYLAVPLPAAVVLQREVVYVSPPNPWDPLGRPAATAYLLQMTQADNVHHLKTELCRVLAEDGGGPAEVPSPDQLTAVEVAGHRVLHALEDWILLRHREDKEIFIVRKLFTANADKSDDAMEDTSALLPPMIPTEVTVPIGPMPMPVTAGVAAEAAVSSSSFSGDVFSGDATLPMPMMEAATMVTASEATATVAGPSVVTVTACGDGQQQSGYHHQDELISASEVLSTQAAMAVDDSEKTDATSAATLPATSLGEVTSTSSTSPSSQQQQQQSQRQQQQQQQHPPPPADDLSCVICMEELPASQLRQHNACTCVMCPPCLERTLEHHENERGAVADPGADAEGGGGVKKGNIRCPGCREEAHPPTEFVTLDQIGISKPKKKTYTVSVLMRVLLQETGETVGGSSPPAVNLFGYPTLLRTQNQVLPSELFSLIAPLLRMPQSAASSSSSSYELALTDASGKWCSRCLLADRCRGCVRLSPASVAEMRGEEEEEVLLQAGDNLAVTFVGGEATTMELELAHLPARHPSTQQERIPGHLSLEECLESFSQSERLDDGNPWHCPRCRKNQSATKTLTIWKLPDFLIIYMKRFVYVKETSCKLEKAVTFPVHDLDLTQFMSGPLRGSSEQARFDLYACVNHVGSVGSGHYTAFCKHPGPRQQWQLYNDSEVQTDRMPGQTRQDQKAAYVLFYERKGASRKYVLPGGEEVSSSSKLENGYHHHYQKDQQQQRCSSSIQH